MDELELKGVLARKKASNVAPTFVIEALSAIACSVPGGASIAKAFEIYGAKQEERAKHILIEEISRGNIKSINQEIIDELFGCTSRYFEACKQGESETNLRILGEFMASGIRRGDLSAREFCYFHRMIESLSDFHIALISIVWKIMQGLFVNDEDQTRRTNWAICIEDSLHWDPLLRQYSINELRSAMGVISSRGIINLKLSAGAQQDGGEFYCPSSDMKRLVEMATNAFERARDTVAANAQRESSPNGHP